MSGGGLRVGEAFELGSMPATLHERPRSPTAAAPPPASGLQVHPRPRLCIAAAPDARWSSGLESGLGPAYEPCRFTGDVDVRPGGNIRKSKAKRKDAKRLAPTTRRRSPPADGPEAAGPNQAQLAMEFIFSPTRDSKLGQPYYQSNDPGLYTEENLAASAALRNASAGQDAFS
eukprot:gene7229-6821_t